MQIVANNKKAFFNYFIEDKFESGIMLEGSEVKSLREGRCNLIDAFVSIVNGEVFLKSCEIPVFKNSTMFQPEPRRVRKLLLNKIEIAKLEQKSKTKGYTIVPTKIYFNEKGKVKVEIALAKGKMLHDKRDVLKEKDLKRDMERETKAH